MLYNFARRNLVVYDIRESSEHFGGVLLFRVSDHCDDGGSFVVLEERSYKCEPVLGG